MEPGALVGHQVVVDRLVQETVPELQGVRDPAQDVCIESLAEEGVDRVLVEAGQCREGVGVEPGPADRSDAEQCPHVLAQGVDARQEQIRERFRQLGSVGNHQLLGVERVALRARDDGVHDGGVGSPRVGGDDAGDAVAVQRTQVQTPGPGCPTELGQCGAERMASMEVVAAEGQHQQ